MMSKPNVRRFILEGVLCAALAFIGLSCSVRLYVSPLPKQPRPEPGESEVRSRLLLIGDAGAPRDTGEPVLRSLTGRAMVLKDRTLVIFLGDNVYERGLHPSPPSPMARRLEAQRRLDAQIAVVQKSGAQGLFIPGNHDWDKGGAQGQAAIEEQERYVEARLGDQSFLPDRACHGPEKKELNELRVIALDTQWWLHEKTKPYASCYPGGTLTSPEAAERKVVERLGDWVSDDRQVVVVAHHPLDTYGPHGGFFDWQDHVFPLTRLVSWLWIPTPGCGSLYPFVRRAKWSDQDVVGARNRKMTEILMSALGRARRPVIYAAGHEHSLQVLEGVTRVGHVLVSGLGSGQKATPVGQKDNTIFADRHPGFMELDFVEDGSVFLRVLEPRGDGRAWDVVFKRWLVERTGF